MEKMYNSDLISRGRRQWITGESGICSTLTGGAICSFTASYIIFQTIMCYAAVPDFVPERLFL